MCADIVIVGGGPVGLWTAIQLKKHSPGLDIQIYERFEEYQRSHVLRLEYLSMIYCAKSNFDQPEKDFYESVIGKKITEIFTKAATGGFSFVRTNDLENALKTYMEELGIHLTYQKIESPEEARKLHPECKDFIAADGAHSKMRQALLGDDSEALIQSPLQYVVEAKYQAKGQAGHLNPVQNYMANKLLTNMTFEYVGREKDGLTPVTLRFFVDDATYEALPPADYKDPMKLDDERLPAALAQDVKTYMNVRKAKAGEEYSEGSASLTKLTLSVYKAKKFALTTEEAVNWYFAGDAGQGVPYFRSLNAGMIMGSQLAGILTREGLSPEAKVAAYNLLTPLDTMWEFTAAKGKNMALEAYDAFRKMNVKLPWDGKLLPKPKKRFEPKK